MLAPRRSLGVALTVVCVPLLFSACDTETFETSPADITGLWSTTHPDYADRALEITPGRLYLLPSSDTFARTDALRFSAAASAPSGSSRRRLPGFIATCQATSNPFPRTTS